MLYGIEVAILWNRWNRGTYLKYFFLVAQTMKNLPAMRETWVWSLGWEDPLEKGMATHSSILAWRISMDRGAWWATVHGATKSQTRLKRFRTHTHSSCHVRIHSTPTPGGWSHIVTVFTSKYSWASLVAQLVKNLPAMRETWVLSLGWEDPLEKGKATLPILA